MVALAWKTRAAPVLHVNTILQALYAGVRCSFEATKSRDLSERTMRLSRLCKRHARSGPQNQRFSCVKLSEVIHNEVGRRRPGSPASVTGFYRSRKSFLAPLGFAAF